MIPRKTNLDWYRERLAFLETFLGPAWFKRSMARAPDRQHPLVQYWSTAHTALSKAKATARFQISDPIASFFDLITDLETTFELKGFAQTITPDVLKGASWEKDYYVVHVAALGVRTGYTVEFLIPSRVAGERTPDLRMVGFGCTFYVECKKKAAFRVSESVPADWGDLESEVLALHEVIDVDYEVVICNVGGRLHSAHPVVSQIAKVLREGNEGEYSGGAKDTVLLIRRAPERPDSVEGVWIPAWQNPSSAVAKVSGASGDRVMYGPMLRCALYIINAPRLSQVLDSFRAARTQIPTDSAGLVFIDVDTSKIASGDKELYFRTITEWLHREFRPDVNTRVAALVVTGGLAYLDTTTHRGFHRTARYWSVLRNPFVADQRPIPGESSQLPADET